MTELKHLVGAKHAHSQSVRFTCPRPPTGDPFTLILPVFLAPLPISSFSARRPLGVVYRLLVDKQAPEVNTYGCTSLAYSGPQWVT